MKYKILGWLYFILGTLIASFVITLLGVPIAGAHSPVSTRNNITSFLGALVLIPIAMYATYTQSIKSCITPDEKMPKHQIAFGILNYIAIAATMFGAGKLADSLGIGIVVCAALIVSFAIYIATAPQPTQPEHVRPWKPVLIPSGIVGIAIAWITIAGFFQRH